MSDALSRSCGLAGRVAALCGPGPARLPDLPLSESFTGGLNPPPTPPSGGGRYREQNQRHCRASEKCFFFCFFLNYFFNSSTTADTVGFCFFCPSVFISHYKTGGILYRITAV